jgi:hypothetical protein
MLEIENIEDLDMFASPNFTRKASDCLAQTNLTAMDSVENCSVIHLQEFVKECRICLERTEDQGHIFSSPCKCMGSLKFVHKVCFLTWLDHQFSSKSPSEQKLMREEGIACEICKQKIYVFFEKAQKCLNSQEVKGKIKGNPSFFAMLLIFLFVICTSLSFIVYYMQNSSISSFGKDIIATSVLSVALAFLLVAAVFTLYYLILQYFMEAKCKLGSFAAQRKIKTKNRKQVIPVSRY